MEDSCLIDNGVSSSSTTTILATQSVRAAVPPILSADSIAFAFPSVVHNLIVLYIILVLLLEYMVVGIGSSTCFVRCLDFWSTAFFTCFLILFSALMN
jgi:hypothetical protein